VVFLARIIDAPIDEKELTRFVSTPASGGIVVFAGIVRNQHEGRAVTSLEYHAARPLADSKLAAICLEVLQDMSIHRVAAVHRTGHLAIGEASVVVAASAAHREDAFRGARRLIDRIKEALPVWKKEHFEDGGAEWAPGFTIGSADRTPGFTSITTPVDRNSGTVTEEV
jgi:molybdopterin synthase catalytic subunit